MKNKKLKSIVIAFALTAAVGSFVGCGSSSSSDSSSDSKKTEVSGNITASGSTALKPLADVAAADFMKKNSKVIITVNAGGSGTGLKDVAAGNVKIGNSDIFANEKLPADQANALVDHKVCVVGFTTIVNENVNVSNLTKEQLVKIFTGKVKNWNEVGGNDLPIVIINRPSSSGTRATFKKYGLDGNEEATGTALTEDSSGAVAKTVKETKGSVSYIASSYLTSDSNKEGLKTVKLDGVEMSKDTIVSGQYSIWSYEHMYTKGEPDEATKAFIDYMTSNDFKKQLTDLGYIPITDMKVSR